MKLMHLTILPVARSEANKIYPFYSWAQLRVMYPKATNERWLNKSTPLHLVPQTNRRKLPEGRSGKWNQAFHFGVLGARGAGTSQTMKGKLNSSPCIPGHLDFALAPTYKEAAILYYYYCIIMICSGGGGWRGGTLV